MITSELKFTHVDALTFRSFLTDKKGLLVDVRTKEEYEDNHIDGAVNFDIYSSKFLEYFENLPLDTSIFVYCNTGVRSKTAIEMLRQSGYIEVYGLRGGIIAWQLLNWPTK